MRLFFALGFLALSTFLGYAKAYSLSARAAALSAFVEEVPQLLLRMDYEALPLSRLAVDMGNRGGLLAPFWAGFSQALEERDADQAWRASLAQNPPYGLTPTDRALFQGLGSSLSLADGAGRKQAVECTLQEAARQRDLLREDMARRGNLYSTLGLLLGLGLAILII